MEGKYDSMGLILKLRRFNRCQLHIPIPKSENKIPNGN